MNQTKTKQIKPIMAWAGNCMNKIDIGMNIREDFKDDIYAIYKTKKEAKKYYEEVIPVLITPVIMGMNNTPIIDKPKSLLGTSKMIIKKGKPVIK